MELSPAASCDAAGATSLALVVSPEVPALVVVDEAPVFVASSFQGLKYQKGRIRVCVKFVEAGHVGVYGGSYTNAVLAARVYDEMYFVARGEREKL
jgi:hypothetical protein